MANLEYLHDILKGLDGGKTLPPEAWLRRPLLPAQRDFVSLPNRFKLFLGGIGSGKSHVGALMALSRMRPGERGLVICPSYRLMSSVSQALLLDFLNAEDCSYTFKKSEESLLFNNCLTFFRSAERVDLLRGLSASWLWCDEMVSEELWKVAMGRLRYGENQQAWLTTTPAGFNWVYDLWTSDNPEYGMVQSSSRQNTYLPEDYLKSLEMNYSGSFADQELEGKFTSPSGLVYSEFSRAVHYVDPFPIPRSWRRVAAIDFGYVHSFACLWVAFDEDGRAYAYKEYKQPQRLLREHAEVLRSGDKVEYFLSDHDSQDRRELHALGINTHAAKKDVVPGIQSVKARLQVQGDGRPRLYVFKSCPKLAKEFGTYSWYETNSQVTADEKVVKIEDDLCDCLRYLSYYEERRSRSCVGTVSAWQLGL